MKNKLTALWLAAICIFIFLLQVYTPNFTSFFILNQQSFVQPYRFLTAIFLHGSLIHLTYNLFALIFFGLILEKFIGSRKFLAVFFISGILANIISVNFYSSALGASGAIFGIIGTLTIIKPLMTVWAFNLPMPLFLAAIFWAIGDILGAFMPSGTANLAHLSGLFFGLIFGFIFKRKQKKSEYNYKINLPENYMQVWENRFVR